MKKMLLTILCCLVFMGSAYAFSDVPETHWAYEQIQTMSEQGMIAGYPDGSFAPNGTLSRAEFLVLMARVLQPDAEHERRYLVAMGV